jgi:hypothetical protein
MDNMKFELFRKKHDFVSKLNRLATMGANSDLVEEVAYEVYYNEKYNHYSEWLVVYFTTKEPVASLVVGPTEADLLDTIVHLVNGISVNNPINNTVVYGYLEAEGYKPVEL